MGNVPAHTPQAHLHPAGIGVPGDQRGVGLTANVHIHAPHHGSIGPGPEHVALAGNVALFHQVGDVHRHRRAGNPRLLCQGLLGDHRVLLNPLQNLPLPLGHSLAPYISKNLFLILCLLYRGQSRKSRGFLKNFFLLFPGPLWATSPA